MRYAREGLIPRRTSLQHSLSLLDVDFPREGKASTCFRAHNVNPPEPLSGADRSIALDSQGCSILAPASMCCEDGLTTVQPGTSSQRDAPVPATLTGGSDDRRPRGGKPSRGAGPDALCEDVARLEGLTAAYSSSWSTSSS